MRRRVSLLLALLFIGPVLSGCSGDEPAATTSTASTGGRSGSLTVLASFYPLEYMARRVLGEAGTVSSLTKPGAEPHDLELAPQDVAAVGKADVVVYLSGFQPAVDEAVQQEGKGGGFDVRGPVRLDLTYTPIEEGEAEPSETGTDPHFWLDPTRLAAVAEAFAQHLGTVDPSRQALFTGNAAALVKELTALDGELRAGLASCAAKELVASHNAFGYLARRYGFTQVGITGLTPEDEPSSGALAAVTRYVREHKVKTIYYETLVSPAIARTVAGETGARTAVLDPIEGLSEASPGTDYPAVMRANLASLRSGQSCS